LELAPTEAGPFSDHLRRHLGNLKQSRELETALEKVVQANGWVSIPSEQAFKLYSMGLVKLQGNSVMPRCDLYHKYFCDRLCQRIEPES
ncbi:AAA-like domain-containing protein, partial [Moorena sp. SIO3H5]|uniref:AAA-like domain-containing protein n=1 Tax=Moorena sp. SIO3H5 TaxID=2607834 RepID=UPI0013BDEE46